MRLACKAVERCFLAEMITESHLQRARPKRQLKASLWPVTCRRQLLAVTFLHPHASANLMSRSLLCSVSTVTVHRLTGFVCDFMKSLASTRRRGTPALKVYRRFAIRLIAIDNYRQGHLVEPPTAPADPSANLEQDAAAFQGLRYGRSLGHFGLASRRQASLPQGTNDLL